MNTKQVREKWWAQEKVEVNCDNKVVGRLTNICI